MMKWTYSLFLDDLWPSLFSLLHTCKMTFLDPFYMLRVLNS
jgi:hypothetical protein